MAENDFSAMLLDAKRGHYAVGAFNIFNHLSAKAVLSAAVELRSPVIIQTSTSTVKKLGVRQLRGMLRVLAEEAGVPVAVHLDHCTSVELAKECVDAGWDSVMIDASHEPLAENIRITREVREYAAARGVRVEGEVGVIKGVEDEISSGVARQTTYEDVLTFLEETQVDAVAPSIGTAHGLYKGEPVIDYDLVKRIASTTECPVVIHGGTGLSDEAFRKLVACGAAKINISTALKQAYFNSAREYLGANPDGSNPLKFDEYLEAGLKQVVKDHLDLFGSTGRARG